MIKLGKQSKSIKSRGEQGNCSVEWLVEVVNNYEKGAWSRVSGNQDYNYIDA